MASIIAQPDYTGLDNSIKAGSGATGTPDYVANNGIIGANFYQTGNRVDFTTQSGRNFTWSPLNMKYVDSTGMEDIIYSVQDVPIEVKANYARFNRPMTDVDDWFIFENNMLKHQILVQGFQRDPAPYLSGEIDFVFGGQINYDSDLTISVDGLLNVTGTFETGGSIRFLDGNGSEVYSLPQIVAYDSGIPNRAQTTGKYRVTQNSPGVLAFDIVVDNAWFADTSRIYPIVIDPTVVVSSAYDTSRQGKKIVELSNGWLVTVALNTSNPATAYIYKSADHGSTWAQLCYVSGIYAASSFQVALTNIGTVCTLVYAVTSTPKALTFDATTVTNTDQSSAGVSIASSFSESTPDGPFVTTDGNGVLHAFFCGIYNNTGLYIYVNYAKSTDGGKTWTTTYGTSGSSHARYPFAVVDNSNKLYVFGAYGTTIAMFTGSNFSTVNTVGTVTTNVVTEVSVVIDKNGVIWVFAYNANPAIYCYKSSDGGNTWTQVTLPSLGTSPTNPSVTTDPNLGDIYLFYTATNGSYTAVYYVKYTASTGTWGSPVLADSNSAGNLSWPNVLYSNWNRNYSSAIRWIYMDAQASAVKYDSIALNNPPNVPSNLSPTGGKAVTSLTPTLSGTFSDPDIGNTMSAIQVQVYRSGDNTLMWDSGKTPMTTTTSNQNWSIQVPLSANLAWQTQYYWIVTTWDNSGAQSAWSGNQVFLTEQAPTVTIVSPTVGQIVTQSSITVQISYSQANNVPEASYQIQLEDANGNTIQDSGLITNMNNMYTFNGLANNTSYQVIAFATSKDTVMGTAAKVSFSTSFTPPSNPVVTGSANPASASMTVNWTNPSSSVAVAYNRLYKQVNGAWVLYQDQLSNTSFTDYLVGSGVATTYGVSAMGTNGVESAIVSITQSVNFTGDWLYNPNNGNQFQFLYSRAAYDMKTQEERKEYQTFGSKPMVRRGPLNARNGTMGALMVKIGTSQTPIQQLQAFEADRLTFPTYYLKTAAGEVLKVDTYNYSRKMPVEYLNTQAIGCQFDWTEVA